MKYKVKSTDEREELVKFVDEVNWLNILFDCPFISENLELTETETWKTHRILQWRLDLKGIFEV